MKQLVYILLFVFMCAACAPAAGRPAISLLGSTQDMINATVAACPTISPSGYNFLSIETLGDNFVSCRASVTTGLAILGALGGTTSPDQRLTISFSTVSEEVVQVAISSFPKDKAIEDQLENALRVQFTLIN